MLSLYFSPISQVSLGKPSWCRAYVQDHSGRGGGSRAGEEPKPKKNGGTGGIEMRGHFRDHNLENE